MRLATVDGRAFLAPEVVQTSAMDCGPAALKCMLEGYGIRASYGRLREACQTSIDGTSIDSVEEVANQLGLRADQALLPDDHLWAEALPALPAIVVVRQNDGSTHFVVVWRRWKRWLQIMDPAIGRRWVSIRRFREDLHQHEQSVAAQDWREWANSDQYVSNLKERICAVGGSTDQAEDLLAEVASDPHWFPVSALEATTRLVSSIISGGGLVRGEASADLLMSLYRRTRAAPDDIYALVPRTYWSVAPDVAASRPGAVMLKARGMVLIHAAEVTAPAKDLSPELAAALDEPSTNSLRTLWAMLRSDGLLGIVALLAAMALGSAVVMLEALLFRGLFDVATLLSLPVQRVTALTALVLLLGFLLAMEFPILNETLRQGRKLEMRFRMALFAKLPRLNDRYFSSRPISDMADRGHSIQQLRNVPMLGFRAVQTMFEVALTVGGVLLIAPEGWAIALLLLLAAAGLPLLSQAFINERDLRVRNQAASLYGFYLDALSGLVPIRAHRAQDAIRRQHEALLTDWARSWRGTLRWMLLSASAQALLTTLIAGWLLWTHFATRGTIGGADLLLVFWVLRLPGLGGTVAGLAQQYPAQRNSLLRLLEPLSAPDDLQDLTAAPAAAGPVAICLKDLHVVAGGHALLSDIDIAIRAGEHVAVVGLSGAGKSTLLGTLLGWHKPSAGTIEIDGQRLDPVALRSVTAWVDPAVQLWNRSLLENLHYATAEPDRGDLAAVLDAAELRAIVEKLPEGLRTRLGEGGCLLSGGEGQRVRLARALFQPNPRLVLLDEPFRGLDRGRRRALLGEALVWWRGSTLLCVTHDIAETRSFDRVLVIEDGRLIEDGDPAVLAGQDTRYRALIEAEVAVRHGLRSGNQWRALTIERGRDATEAAA